MRQRHKISLKINKMHTINLLVHWLRNTVIIATLLHICSYTHTI